MTACKFTTRITTTGNSPWASHSQCVTRLFCEAHDWQFDEEYVLTSTNGTPAFCPLGRIEEATELALARIEKALEGKND